MKTKQRVTAELRWCCIVDDGELGRRATVDWELRRAQKSRRRRRNAADSFGGGRESVRVSEGGLFGVIVFCLDR